MNIRKITSGLMAFILMAGAAVFSQPINRETTVVNAAQEMYLYTIYSYEDCNDHAAVTGLRPYGGTPEMYDLMFPETLGGLPVTEIRYCREKSAEGAEFHSGIKVIGSNACRDLKMKHVTFSEGLEEIRDGAFAGNNIKEISLPASLKLIGTDAFAGNELTGITVAEDSKSFAEKDGILYSKDMTKIVLAYSNPEKLSIPSSVTSVDLKAIKNTVKELTVSDGNKNLVFKDGALYDMKEKRLVLCLDSTESDEFIIDSSVTSIDPGAFRGCKNISKVILPAGLESIGEYCFAESGIEDIVFPDGLVYIGNSAFEQTNITSAVLPDSVTYIGTAAFDSCTHLSEVRLSEKLTEIPEKAFRSTGISELTLPSGLTAVGYNAFDKSPLKTVYLNSSQRHLTSKFGYCKNFIYTDEDEGINDEGVIFSKDMKTLVSYPADIKAESYVVPSGVEVINDNAFSGNRYLKSVILPDGLRKIGNNAFEKSFIESLDIPDTVTEMGKNVFQSCTSLTSVRLSDSLEEIPENAFDGCYYLKSLNIPAAVRALNKGDVPKFTEELYTTEYTTEFESKVFSDTDLKCIFGVSGSEAEKAAKAAGIRFLPEHRILSADADKNGLVNIIDFIKLKNLLSGGKYDIYADTNNDGSVNVSDLVYMKEIILGCNEKPKKSYRDISTYSVRTKDKLKLFSNAQIILRSTEDLDNYIEASGFSDSYAVDLLKSKLTPLLDEFTVYIYNSVSDEKQTVAFNADKYDISSSVIKAEFIKTDYEGYLSGTDNYYINAVIIPDEMYAGQKLDVTDDVKHIHPDKPVIYLYPEEKTEINVKIELDNKTGFTYTYPQYSEENGWTVTAEPDSTLYDKDGKEYSYLFWEAQTLRNWNQDEGFVVKGSDTVAFLQEKLAYLGLTPKEYNDFIVYWMPKMMKNEYNLITFQTKNYEDMAKLTITPEPDCIQRVFMTFKALDSYTEVPEQQLKPFTRHGYTVIEWGGAEV